MTTASTVCLFLFDVVRGISTGAWLPWLTALVRANDRSAFLRFDQLSVGIFQVSRFSTYYVLLSLLGIDTFSLARRLVKKKGKPFDTAIRDVVILARLKLYGRLFNR